MKVIALKPVSLIFITLLSKLRHRSRDTVPRGSCSGIANRLPVLVWRKHPAPLQSRSQGQERERMREKNKKKMDATLTCRSVWQRWVGRGKGWSWRGTWGQGDGWLITCIVDPAAGGGEWQGNANKGCRKNPFHRNFLSIQRSSWRQVASSLVVGAALAQVLHTCCDSEWRTRVVSLQKSENGSFSLWGMSYLPVYLYDSGNDSFPQLSVSYLFVYMWDSGDNYVLMTELSLIFPLNHGGVDCFLCLGMKLLSTTKRIIDSLAWLFLCFLLEKLISRFLSFSLFLTAANLRIDLFS